MLQLPRLALFVALSAATSFAVPVTWTLSGVTFSDGGTASGSFVYDANTGQYSSINITTTTGSLRSGSTYHFEASIFSAQFSLMVTQASGDLTGTPALFLAFTSGLTNAGGTIPLLVGSDPDNDSSEDACNNATCGNAADPERLATVGSVTATPAVNPTPAPPTWTLSLVGLVIAGGTMLVMNRRAFRKSRA